MRITDIGWSRAEKHLECVCCPDASSTQEVSLQPRAMDPLVPNPFILYSTQRSGSTWVVDMLNSHPEVRAYSELFLAGGRGRPQWGGSKDLVFWETYLQQRRTEAPKAGIDSLLFQYLDDLYRGSDQISAVGFKLMYGQAGAYPKIMEYASLHNVGIIHLIRRNYLDTLISKEIAAQRDLYHTRKGDPVQQTTVRLDAGDLVERLAAQEKEVEKAERRLRAQGARVLEVAYEDLRADTSGFAAMLGWLGVMNDGFSLQSTLQRIVQTPHYKVIKNYADVRRALEGTRFHQLLHDPSAAQAIP